MALCHHRHKSHIQQTKRIAPSLPKRGLLGSTNRVIASMLVSELVSLQSEDGPEPKALPVSGPPEGGPQCIYDLNVRRKFCHHTFRVRH